MVQAILGQAVDIKHITGTSIINSFGDAKPRTITIHGGGNLGLLLSLMPLQEAPLPRIESCHSRLEMCRIYGALKLYDWGRSTERFRKDFGGILEGFWRDFGKILERLRAFRVLRTPNCGHLEQLIDHRRNQGGWQKRRYADFADF